MGIPTAEEMQELAKKRNFFPDKDRLELESLERKLDGQRAILAKTTKVPARRERLVNIIKDLESKVFSLQRKRDKHLENTSERKAIEEKLLYLCWCNSFNPFTEKLLWDDYTSFQNEKDILFRRNVFTEFVVFYHGVRTSTMRYIARSSLWRIRYSAAIKTGNDLFGCPIKDYTTDQLMLSYWSSYYQSIYEMLSDDRPPESIIEDDEALDAYMKDWQADRNREATASRHKKNNKYGKPTAWDHGETYVMKSNDMYDDIEYSKTLKELKKDSGKGVLDAAPATRDGRKNRR